MDEELAEQKDYMFFSRVLKGISDSQQDDGYSQHSHNFRLQTQSLVSHIIHTRQDRPPPTLDLDDEDENDWTPGLSNSRSAFLLNVTTSALIVAEEDDGIFDLEL
jgi:hypothetical protein